ncbi:tyrosine-type recombinase/integrase [Bradyrhizobium nanningense]|uniref:tyrosine-type recombinase/integrase n=1 Tax=Bradyrhizobium nanningense TaxID=1325118 RepID=UPI0024C0AF5F|nr:tyrosine-type recombinase/integrase [Bradyrhizobium nanningense]
MLPRGCPQRYPEALQCEVVHRQVFSMGQSSGDNNAVQPHTLRFAAARRLAELGLSLKVIASITGHDCLKELERYTKAAAQKLLAKQAIDALGSHWPTGSHPARLRIALQTRGRSSAWSHTTTPPRLIGWGNVPSSTHLSNVEGDTPT